VSPGAGRSGIGSIARRCRSSWDVIVIPFPLAIVCSDDRRITSRGGAGLLHRSEARATGAPHHPDGVNSSGDV
jgi:hypothetical protein